MNTHDDLDRMLGDWLETEARSPAPAGRLEQALDITRGRRPRPVWLAGFGGHWVGGSAAPGRRSEVRSFRRPSVALMLLAVLLTTLLGGAIIMGARLLAPAPVVPFDALAYALDGDIFVAEWDGSDPILVADGLPGSRPGCGSAGNWADGPMWSPDGRYLAFRLGKDQVTCPTLGNLAIADPDGRIVASIPGYGWEPGWSPDADRVAIWTDRDLDEVGVYRLDGTREAVLTIPDGYGVPGDLDPRWSPDGRSLLIPLDENTIPFGSGPDRQIWELPLDRRDPRPVPVHDPRSHWSASWSADGGHVAFFEGESVESGRRLMVAAADGSKARVLAAAGSYEILDGVLMSPNGHQVAFMSASRGYPGITDQGIRPDELRLVDVATGAVTVLVEAAVSTNWPVAIAFSADGDRVLFSKAALGDAPLSLWSVRTDGSGTQLLVAEAEVGDWRPMLSRP